MRRRPISLVVLAALAASLIGCKGTGPDAEKPKTEVSAQPANFSIEESTPSDYALNLPPTFPRWTGDWDEISKKRAGLRMLVVYSKTSYFYDKGRPRGLNVDIARELEIYLNKRLKTGARKFSVAPIPVTTAELLPALNEGKGDIIAAGLFVTPEREKLVDFTMPIISGAKLIVITNKSVPAVTKVEDLSGREIVVNKNTLAYELLKEQDSRLKQAGRPGIRVVEADSNLLEEDLLEMTNAGIIPATVAYDKRAELWTEVFPELVLNSGAVLKESGDLAWAIRKDSPQLKAVLDDFLKDHKQGTVFGRIMFARYFKGGKILKNSTSPEELRKYEAFVKYFQKYGGEYDFDYLMLAAQGYQESMLEQSRKSPRGAVGVMQVLPQYAKAHPINIPNVNDPDNNIHAGTKMLAQIAKAYFNDPAITPMNKTLFTFAAYNAGQNRIVRLRKQAQEEGLDPNKWFGNVELVVAKDIGQETVQYVGNIYKYFVAYKMAQEQAELRKTAKQAPVGN